VITQIIYVKKSPKDVLAFTIFFMRSIGSELATV